MRFAHTGTLTHTQTNSQTNSLCSMFLCVVFFCVCESSTARETCVGVGKLALRRRSSAHCPNQFSEPVFGLTYFFVHDSCKSHHRHVSFILWAPMTSSCSKNGDELVLSFCTHTKHHLPVFFISIIMLVILKVMKCNFHTCSRFLSNMLDRTNSDNKSKKFLISTFFFLFAFNNYLTSTYWLHMLYVVLLNFL